MTKPKEKETMETLAKKLVYFFVEQGKIVHVDRFESGWSAKRYASFNFPYATVCLVVGLQDDQQTASNVRITDAALS
jgi:hypothetical protein